MVTSIAAIAPRREAFEDMGPAQIISPRTTRGMDEKKSAKRKLTEGSARKNAFA
ncbi:hypothetical protein ABZR86_15795 [Dyella marensis]|jgi:hypothetical protein|uniref:hypothetical protein n=1 Tax=Dyella TaxID=231454 RepID=UPI0015A71BB3|nr:MULTISPECIES: hypothetical protein [Dyella]